LKINIEKDVTNNTKQSHEYSISPIVVVPHVLSHHRLYHNTNNV